MKTLAVLALATFGMFAQTLSDKTAKKLSDTQVASTWSRMPTTMHRTASVNLVQAQATIEVSTSGQSVTATFNSLVPLPDSTIAFRMTLPSGLVVPMEGYEVSWDGGTVSATLWNGEFPGVWPSGQTLLEAIIISRGSASYVSAYVSVKSCCALMGPLERADISADGNTIDVTGSFQEGTIATINGQQVPVSIVFSPTTGLPQGKIDVSNVYEGQKTLTFCSGGQCSSRVIYITRQTTPTPPSPNQR
jgi:hypothetical protein